MQPTIPSVIDLYRWMIHWKKSVWCDSDDTLTVARINLIYTCLVKKPSRSTCGLGVQDIRHLLEYRYDMSNEKIAALINILESSDGRKQLKELDKGCQFRGEPVMKGK